MIQLDSYGGVKGKTISLLVEGRTLLS